MIILFVYMYLLLTFASFPHRSEAAIFLMEYPFDEGVSLPRSPGFLPGLAANCHLRQGQSDHANAAYAAYATTTANAHAHATTNADAATTTANAAYAAYSTYAANATDAATTDADAADATTATNATTAATAATAATTADAAPRAGGACTDHHYTVFGQPGFHRRDRATQRSGL